MLNRLAYEHTVEWIAMHVRQLVQLQDTRLIQVQCVNQMPMASACRR